MKMLSHDDYKQEIERKTNGEYTVASEYFGMGKPIKIRHNKCGRVYDLKHASGGYYSKLSCAECNYSYVDRDYPWLAVNFKNQSETHIPKSSKREVELICPCCKKTVTMKVYQYIRAGYVGCDTCGDGYSYCEKFVANVLHQAGINPIRQFSPEWLCGYRYDFQFNLNGNKYIIETDGGIGHGYTTAYGTDKDNSLERDHLKDSLAFQHGYNVIRINCHYENKNRMEFIKKNIQDALVDIIDLSCVDWDKCNEYAIESKFKKAIEIYKSETPYVSEIADALDIKLRTARKYLNNAMQSGLIPKAKLFSYRPAKEAKSDVLKLSDPASWGKPLYCYEDALIFQSVSDAERYYNAKSCIEPAMRKNGYYKGRHFVYLKELPNDFDFEKKYFPEPPKGLAHMVSQYTKDDKLIKVYFRLSDLPAGMDKETIKRSCRGKRKTAYGYKWKYVSKKDEFEIIAQMSDKSGFSRSYFVSN